ncbi:MAG: hypothetical protein NVS1B11_32180 [Terriglobales bacterium]
MNPNQRSQKSNDGRIVYEVYFEVGDQERALCNREFLIGHAGLSLLERLAGYQDGVLYDDGLLASLRAFEQSLHVTK